MNVLVTGFGPFPNVPDNPSGALALAVDGAVIRGHWVHGIEIPTSYDRGPSAAIAAARRLDARLVVGLGVATTRTGVCVERCAHRVEAAGADVDGVCTPGLLGPEMITATLDCDRLVEALGGRLSDDAGRYVCNAWLYAVSSALDVPVGFVHVPPVGLERAVLLRGLAALLV